MARIELQHQGFDIYYGENDDLWHCTHLRIEAKTLSKAKQKINEHVRNALKTIDLQFGLIEWSNVKKVQIVGRDATTGQFWVMGEDGRRSREKLEKLTPWSDDIQAKLDEAERLGKEANALLRQSREIKESIKPFTGEDLDRMLADLMKRVAAEEE